MDPAAWQDSDNHSVEMDIRPIDTAVDIHSSTMRDRKGDENLYVEFKEVPIFSKAKGRHINVLHTEIHLQGLARDVVCRPTKEEDKHRFPRQWNAYVNKTDKRPEGLPIEELPFLNEAVRADLKGMKIFTAEQIINLPDTALSILGPGARGIQTKVSAWLDQQKGGSLIDTVVEENKKLQFENQEQAETIKELLSRVTALEVTASPKKAKKVKSESA